MNPIDFLAQYYDSRSKAFKILVEHGKRVAKKARAAAKRVPGLKPDLVFINTAAMLHDIGIFLDPQPGFWLLRKTSLYLPRHPGKSSC